MILAKRPRRYELPRGRLGISTSTAGMNGIVVSVYLEVVYRRREEEVNTRGERWREVEGCSLFVWYVVSLRRQKLEKTFE